MIANVKTEVDTLLRARYPVLCLVSAEEKRTEEVLRLVLDGRGGGALYTWSITEGLKLGQATKVDGTVDPIKALRYLLEARPEARTLYVMRDFHPYLKNPEVVRLLRDCHRELRGTNKTLVLLGPVPAIPPECEKEVAVIEVPLPRVEELLVSVNSIAQLSPNIKSADPVLFSQVAEAALGLTRDEAEAAFAKCLVQNKGVFHVDAITAEKARIVKKSGILEFIEPSKSFNEVGGLDQLKGWIGKRKAAFSADARSFGLPPPKGVLLLGVPGGGKSLTAQAVGATWQLPLLRLDVGKIFAGIVGSSEENMRRAIATAEAVAPCILWIDEVEKGFSGSGSSGQTDGGTTARVFGSFLTWLQEKQSQVFVIATANDVSALPPEMLRKGRFDEIFFVDLPSEVERKEIAKIHIARRGRDPGKFELQAIAEASSSFTGAEIEQAVVSALFDAYDTGKQELTTEGILVALRETVPLARTMKEPIERLRAWSAQRARLASKPVSAAEKVHRKIDLV